MDPLLGDHAARIRRNAFLHAIYEDVYARLADAVPEGRYPRVLEIGSGAGFLRAAMPHVITSDLVEGPGIDRVLDACRLDAYLPPASLDALVGMNVFHHLPDPVGFLRGAAAVLRPGGRIALVEPWFTPIGQWFYRAIHHEPVLNDPDAWRIAGEGRLDGANSRLPTSVFRDRLARLAREVPELAVVEAAPFHKWLYLFSGGLKLDTKVPRPVARALLRLDRATAPLDPVFGIFARIVVERREAIERGEAMR